MTVDRDGRLYSADFGGTTVLRVSLDGQVSEFAGGFKTPSGNAFDSAGRLYQSNYRDPANDGAPDSISRVGPDGSVSTWVDGVDGPVGIAIDKRDNLFVAMCNANNVTRIDRDGVPSVLATSPLFACPNGITFDDRGVLYVVNFGDGSLIKVTAGGRVSLLATIPGSGNGHVAYVSGSLFVASLQGNQLFRVRLPGGQVELLSGDGLAGSVDGPNSAARFNAPNGVARSARGDELYVNQSGGTIRALDLTFQRPLKPKSLRVDQKPSGAVRLRWQMRSRNIESFRVEAREGSQRFQVLAEVPSSRRRALIRGLSPGTSYRFRVVAVNPSGQRASKKVRFVTEDQ